MKVKLSAVPNPDYPRSSHNGSVRIKAAWQTVDSVFAASKACKKFIDDNNLGSGNFTGGQIVDDDGQTVGYVSYNGRVWESEEYPCKEIVFA